MGFLMFSGCNCIYSAFTVDFPQDIWYNTRMKDKSGNDMRETFSSHWLTIQPSLFNFIEDEVGELDEEQRLFVRVAESLELRQIAARYGWCGNGRKPSNQPGTVPVKFLLDKDKPLFPFGRSQVVLTLCRRNAICVCITELRTQNAKINVGPLNFRQIQVTRLNIASGFFLKQENIKGIDRDSPRYPVCVS